MKKYASAMFPDWEKLGNELRQGTYQQYFMFANISAKR